MHPGDNYFIKLMCSNKRSRLILACFPRFLHHLRKIIHIYQICTQRKNNYFHEIFQNVRQKWVSFFFEPPCTVIRSCIHIEMSELTRFTHWMKSIKMGGSRYNNITQSNLRYSECNSEIVSKVSTLSN